MEPNGQETQHTPKPRQVTNAVYLIYASIAVAALSLIIGMVSSYQAGIEFSTALSILTCSGINYTIMIFVATRIAGGRNWARTLTLIFFVLGVLGIICDYRSYLANPLSAANLVITGILHLTAIILLYQQPSNDWFKSMNQLHKQESEPSDQPVTDGAQHPAVDGVPFNGSATSEKEEIPVPKIVTIAAAVGAGMGLMNAVFWSVSIPIESEVEREMIYFLIIGGLTLGAALGAIFGYLFLSFARQDPRRSPVHWAILGGIFGGVISFGCGFFVTALSFV